MPDRLDYPRMQLGECPRVDELTSTLSWVDLPRGRLWLAPVTPTGLDAGARLLIDWGGDMGHAVRSADGGWLLGHGGDLVSWSEGVKRRLVSHLEPDLALTRLNDAAVDARGRLWIGSIPVPRPLEPVARVHRVSRFGTSEVVMDCLLAANGMGFSPDGEVTYVVDSGRRCLHRLREISDEVLVAEEPVQINGGIPDGVTVDREGHIWIALWDGGRVVRLDPHGRVVQEIRLPCSRPTACVLVGTTLVITTAAVSGEPESGWLYGVDVAVGGVPSFRARLEGSLPTNDTETGDRA